MTNVKAIFENGVFKPTTPVALPDKQRVEIDVRPVTAFDMTAWLTRVRRRQQAIVARAGVLPDSTGDIAADRRRDG
jgi:predicted DNA-binding antitoxin AbrB/MazE fold protein